MTEARSLYSILGVDRAAGADSIERAFREKHAALERDGFSSDEMSLLRVAYDTLKNPQLRSRYDARQALLADEARQVVVTSEGDEAPVEERRNGRFLRVLLLLFVAALAYWMFQPAVSHVREPEASIKTEVQDPVVAPSENDEPEMSESPVVTAPMASSPVASAPAFSADVRQETSVQNVEQRRPPRSPGFDANYLAWSAYFVIRPGVASGSGVLVAPDKILTNCHVLAGAALSGITVVNSMTRVAAPVREYARLDDDDACLLHAPGAGSDVIEWGRSASLGFGDATHTFGHPGGSSNLIWSSGAFERRMAVSGRGEEVLVTNNYCRPGSSGGPLLDGEGRLVGIVTAVERFAGKTQETIYGKCLSVTEATARELLRKPMFPIAMAPASYRKNY